MSSFTFTVSRRDLAWGVALLVLLSAVWVARSDLAGAGEEAPAGEGIARVYIAVGTNYPDALGVGPGAGANGAPIIILPTNPPIPSESEAELVRLDPRQVTIIGGTSAISDAMEIALGALLPNATIDRLAGTNRYATNAAFSSATFPIEEWIALPAVAFMTNNPDADVASIFPHFAFSGSDGDLYAPIHLPHGAEILELRAEVIDGITDNITAVTVELTRYASQLTDQVAMVASPVNSGDGEMVLTTIDIAQGLEVVDNSDSAYLIQVSGAYGSGGVDLMLRSVMVRYRLGAP